MSPPRWRKRRQFERHHVQAEVQVLAKPLLLDHLGQLLIGGGQHPGIGRNRRWTRPTRTITFSSKTRSNLAWQFRLKSPISSRNNVPPEASSNLPGRDSWASVKAPFSCPKSSLSARRLGDGGAVQGDKRLTAAATEIVDRLRHDFLARPILAVNEHGQVGLRHAANDRPQRLDCRAFADQPHAFRRLVGDLAVGRHQLLTVLDVFQCHGRVVRPVRSGPLDLPA